MKIVLTAARHPYLTRPEFFGHLRHRHWPMLASYPRVLRHIRRYVQNHGILPDEDGGITTPWRRATERDSVIEVWFETDESLDRMNAEPEYAGQVAADERVFNDLDRNVLLASRERVYHQVRLPGRLRRFDFLYAAGGENRRALTDLIDAACQAAALDPGFQAFSDHLSVHFPLREASVKDAGCVAVIKLATASADALSRLADPRFFGGFSNRIDERASFSVVATSFPMHPTIR